MSRPRIVLVAGNHAQARQFCWLENLDPKGPEVIIASHAGALRGVAGPVELRYVGTGFTRRDALEIAEYVAIINAGVKKA